MGTKDTIVPQAMEDIENRTPEELRDIVEILDAHLKSLHQTDAGELRSLDSAEQAAFDLGLEIREAAIAKLEEHRRISEVFRQRPQAVQRALSNIRAGLPDYAGDVRRLTYAEARDQALRRLDSRNDTMHLSDAAKSQVERSIRRDPDTARRILVTENDAYRSAFMKLTTQVDALGFLEQEERDAVRMYNEYRAMSESTTTAGGYGIPVKLAA